MEANRDAALHYLELAEKAILVEETERAVRYINKSEDLYPTQRAKGKSTIFAKMTVCVFFASRPSRTN